MALVTHRQVHETQGADLQRAGELRTQFCMVIQLNLLPRETRSRQCSVRARFYHWCLKREVIFFQYPFALAQLSAGTAEVARLL